MQEVETKILNIDEEEVTKKILATGAQVEYDTELINHIYRKKKFNGFFRIRERDGRVFTTLKIKHGSDENGIKRREEREHEVSSKEEGEREAEALGFTYKTTNTKHRTKYKLGNVVFLIDRVPNIKPYLEVESDNENTVIAWVEKLGFSREDMSAKGAGQLIEESK